MECTGERDAVYDPRGPSRVLGNKEGLITQRTGTRKELVPEKCRLGETVNSDHQLAEQAENESGQGGRRHRNDAKEDQRDDRHWCEDGILDYLISADARDSDKSGHIGSSRPAAEVEKKKDDRNVLENEWDIVGPPPEKVEAEARIHVGKCKQEPDPGCCDRGQRRQPEA